MSATLYEFVKNKLLGSFFCQSFIFSKFNDSWVINDKVMVEVVINNKNLAFFSCIVGNHIDDHHE